MAKKTKKKANKSKKQVKKEYIPRKTIVNVPSKPIDPAKIERERKRKNKERKEKKMMEKMGILPVEQPKTSEIITKSIAKPTRVHPVLGNDLVIKFRKDFDAKTPNYAYDGDAGLDIYSNEEKILNPMHRAPIKTGLYFELPQGHVGLVWDKSGLALRSGVHAMAGVLDCNYRGELKVVLINLSSKPIKIEKGVKIAQLLIQRIERARLQESSSLQDSERGSGGFGSSGLKENIEVKKHPILEIDTTKEKPRHSIKLGEKKPNYLDIKDAIKDDVDYEDND